MMLGKHGVAYARTDCVALTSMCLANLRDQLLNVSPGGPWYWGQTRRSVDADGKILSLVIQRP